MVHYYRLGTAILGANKSAGQSTPCTKRGKLGWGLVVWT
jgi:hypothetical protein